MSIVRIAVVGVSILMLGVGAAWAADSGAVATATAPATPRDATPVKTEAAAAKGDALKNAIVGNWKCVDDGEVMEFAADGNGRVRDPNAMFVATYKLLDDGSLHLEVPVFGKQKDFLYTVELRGDEMTLTLPDKKPRKFLRVK